MLGTLQTSTTRIEVSARAETLQRCLSQTDLVRQWIWPQTIAADAPSVLQQGSEYAVHIGPLTLYHSIEMFTSTRLRVILWGAADGYCEWSWGNGWVQLQVEAISILPLSLGQFLNLRQLQHFAAQQESH